MKGNSRDSYHVPFWLTNDVSASDQIWPIWRVFKKEKEKEKYTEEKDELFKTLLSNIGWVDYCALVKGDILKE